MQLTVRVHADPLIDSWPFKLEYRHNGQHRQIMLHSAQRLNMIVTPAAFRSVGDVRSFAHLLLGKPAALGAMPAAAARAVGSWLGLGKPRITSLYRWGDGLTLLARKGCRWLTQVPGQVTAQPGCGVLAGPGQASYHLAVQPRLIA